MKRSRQLERTVTEIVKVARSRDTQGSPLYPEILTDGIAMALFLAPEALLGALKERPIMVLNLIETNRAVNAVMSKFLNIWIILIDSLLERVIPGQDELYPFFAVMNARLHGRSEKIDKKAASFLQRSEFLGASLMDTDLVLGLKMTMKKPLFLTCASGDMCFPEEDNAFFLVPYDPLTKIYIGILQRMHRLGAHFGQPFVPRFLLVSYLDKIGLLTDFYSLEKGYIVCLENDFLINSYTSAILNKGKPKRCDIAYLKSMQEEITEAYSIIHVPTWVSHQSVAHYDKSSGNQTNNVAELFDELRSKIEELGNSIKYRPSGEECPAFESARLDAKTARPYREKLYTNTDALYKTAYEQKAFFVAILTKLAELSSSEEMRKNYGQVLPLACAQCNNETHLVDPVQHKLAFCQINCWKQYSSTC